MQTKKQVKKYGNSLIIVITAEESRAYNIKEGEFLDVTINKEDKKKHGK